MALADSEVNKSLMYCSVTKGSLKQLQGFMRLIWSCKSAWKISHINDNNIGSSTYCVYKGKSVHF